MSKLILALLCFVMFSGCKTVPKPSKYGTAMDQIKVELKDGIERNKSIKPTANIPIYVQDALSPNVTIKKEEIAVTPPNKKFSIVAESIDAKAFFLGLVEDTSVNLILHPKVEGNISLKLKNVSIIEVLDLVRRVYGYGYEETVQGIKIFPATLQTRSYKINYLDMKRNGTSETQITSAGLSGGGGGSGGDEDSESGESSSGGGSVNSQITSQIHADYWSELSKTLSIIVGNEEGRKVAVSRMAGIVIIQAMPDELLRVESFLEKSEKALNRQVILEAKVLEVELNDGYRAGINWGMIGTHLKASQLGGNLHGGEDVSTTLPAASAIEGGNATADLAIDSANRIAPNIPSIAGAYGGILTLGINYRKIAAFIELLASQGNVQVLSSPRVSTTNNQKALIKVGTDEYFVTNITTTTSVTAGVTVTQPTVEFEPFFSGIALDVTPQISDNGDITLHVHPTISTVTEKDKTVAFGGNTNRYPLARTTIRESDSIVRAKNGQMVIIGGLMQDRTKEVVTGVPVLKDIPFFGKAFRQTRQVALKSELVILLRPIILDDNVLTSELEGSLERFEGLDRGFHLGGHPDVYGTMAEQG